MGACKNCTGALIDECGEFIYAPCIIVQSTIDDISEFSDADCVTLHDLIPEIYTFLAGLYIDDSFNKKCLDITADATHQQIEQAQTDEICDLKDNVATLSCLKGILALPVAAIGDCDASGLDVECLQTEDCGIPVPLTTFGEVVQAMIDKICELEERVLTLESA